MFVVTLICAPTRADLSSETVETLRNAWGGRDAIWLNPGLAAEFSIDQLPANQWDVWAELQKLGVDLAIQPAVGRRKKMLLADMDSTMIGQECIDELADLAGVGERVAGITARAMNGELDFDEALTERVGLLAGLPETIIQEVLASRITLAPGGAMLLSVMKKNGGYAALVSGGFTAFTQAVAQQLGFDEHRANRLLAQDGHLTGEVARPILGRQAKVDALHEITARLGLSPDDVMAVGDGANDLGMLHLAGSGVALHAKPSVAEQCTLRINHGDLTALLYLQGYRAADFT